MSTRKNGWTSSAEIKAIAKELGGCGFTLWYREPDYIAVDKMEGTKEKDYQAYYTSSHNARRIIKTSKVISARYNVSLEDAILFFLSDELWAEFYRH